MDIVLHILYEAFVNHPIITAIFIALTYAEIKS